MQRRHELGTRFRSYTLEVAKAAVGDAWAFCFGNRWRALFVALTYCAIFAVLGIAAHLLSSEQSRRTFAGLARDYAATALAALIVSLALFVLVAFVQLVRQPWKRETRLRRECQGALRRLTGERDAARNELDELSDTRPNLGLVFGEGDPYKHSDEVGASDYVEVVRVGICNRNPSHHVSGAYLELSALRWPDGSPGQFLPAKLTLKDRPGTSQFDAGGRGTGPPYLAGTVRFIQKDAEVTLAPNETRYVDVAFYRYNRIHQIVLAYESSDPCTVPIGGEYRLVLCPRTAQWRGESYEFALSARPEAVHGGALSLRPVPCSAHP